jgi:hypothetical protein
MYNRLSEPLFAVCGFFFMFGPIVLIHAPRFSRVRQIVAFSHFEVWIKGLFLAASVIFHNHPAKKMKSWFWYRNKIAESAKLIDFSATFLPSTLLSVALSDQHLNLTFCRQEIPRQNAHAAITQEWAAELNHVAAKK